MKMIISGESSYTERILLEQNNGKYKKDKNNISFFLKKVLKKIISFVALIVISFVGTALMIGNAMMGELFISGEPFFSFYILVPLFYIFLGVIILMFISLVSYLSLEKGTLSNLLRIVISLSLLEVLLINIFLFPNLQLLAWLHMWSIAIWMYAFFKWMTLAYGRHSKRFSIIGSLIYLFGWVGMNPDPFLNASTKKSKQWNSSLFIKGFRNLSIGVLLFFGIHYSDTNLHFYYNMPWLLQSWIICVGLIMVLHFGLFHLLAWFWQGMGYSVKPIMSNPLASQKISEFWGGRWNIAFKHIVSPFLFMPLKRKLGPSWGVFCTFLFSGLVHELAISLPAGAGYGLPTLYFLIQAVGMRIERLNLSWLPQKLFTYIMIIGPAFILFHPPFMKEIIIPFAVILGILN